MTDSTDSEHRPYIHLMPPRELPGGGIQLRFRADNAKVYTVTIPRRQSTVTGIHEAVMATIQSDKPGPKTP